jgi:hypothetical protein
VLAASMGRLRRSLRRETPSRPSDFVLPPLAHAAREQPRIVAHRERVSFLGEGSAWICVRDKRHGSPACASPRASRRGAFPGQRRRERKSAPVLRHARCHLCQRVGCASLMPAAAERASFPDFRPAGRKLAGIRAEGFARQSSAFAPSPLRFCSRSSDLSRQPALLESARLPMRVPSSAQTTTVTVTAPAIASRVPNSTCRWRR